MLCNTPFFVENKKKSHGCFETAFNSGPLRDYCSAFLKYDFMSSLYHYCSQGD